MNTKVQEGEKLFAAGNIEQAEACFLQVLREQPGCVEALNNLGVIAVQRGDAETAERQFQRALEAQPDFAPALGNLALIHRHNRHWDMAIDCLERYMAVDATNPIALNQLGLAYLRIGREADAERILKRSLALDPDQPVVMETLQTLVDLDDSEKEEQAASSILRGEGPPADEDEDDTPATPVRFGKTDRSAPPISPAPVTQPRAPEPATHSSPVGGTSGDDEKLNILFVQDVPCIRNYKTATALRSRGHRVTLCYVRTKLGDIYQGLGDDTYDAVFQLTEPRRLWDVSEQFDVIHCHNEPDHYTGMALAGNAPVVHDTHDLISLRHPEDASLAYHEGIANRSADGRVYSTPYQRDEARRLYDVQGPSLVFYNYASQGDLPARFLPKLSQQDGKVHIVYEGGIGNTAHRDYLELFRDLSARDIHVHIYPPRENPAMRELYGQFANVHFHDPVSPRRIIEEMSQYDYGIIPFNLETGNKRFLDSTIANKLFEYLAAGLPVLASPLQSYVDYFRRNPVGVTFESADDIIAQLPRLREIARATDFSKQVYTYEGEVDRLIDFYREVIAASPKGGGGKSETVPDRQRVPVSRLQEAQAQPAASATNPEKPVDVHESLDALLAWLDANGWDGHDPYDLFNYFIQQHKAGTPVPTERQQSLVNRAAVDPMGVRRELGIAPQRNAKGLGLLTAARVRLYKVNGDARHLNEAIQLAEWLLKHSSRGYANLCWGYPFDWQSVIFIPQDTPSAVVSTAVGDGLWELYTVTRKQKYLDACSSICRFITEDLKRDDLGDNGVCFSYTPIDDYHVHNANLFCGEFLARVGREVGNGRWTELALRTARYAMSEQNPDGSIYYWGRVQNRFAPNKIDHYHSGFEIRCLFNIARHTGDDDVKVAASRYLKFYLDRLCGADGLPKLTPHNPYPVDIHACAEAVLMLSVLSRESSDLLKRAENSLQWTLRNMQTAEGWFAYRWTPDVRCDAPFLRWGQAWMLRAISEYLVACERDRGTWGYRSEVSDTPGRKARDGSLDTREDVAWEPASVRPAEPQPVPAPMAEDGRWRTETTDRPAQGTTPPDAATVEPVPDKARRSSRFGTVQPFGVARRKTAAAPGKRQGTQPTPVEMPTDAAIEAKRPPAMPDPIAAMNDSAALAQAAKEAVGLGNPTDLSPGGQPTSQPRPATSSVARGAPETQTPDAGEVQILMPEAGQYAYGTRDWAETLFKGAKTDPWGHDWRASQRARYLAAMGLVNHQLNGAPVADVLDIGCCLGDFTAEMADRFDGCRVLGVDISEEAVRKCSDRFTSDGRLAFEQAALPELAVSRGGFDFVSALEVIYYVGTPDRIDQSLRRIHELMNPGAWLLISSCLNRPPFRTAEPFEEMVSRHFTVVDKTLRYHGLYSSQETLVRQSMQAAKMLAGAASPAGKAAVEEYLQAGVKLLGNVGLVEDLNNYAKRRMGSKGMSHAIVLARKDR